MALDPRKLRPGELARLLNSTPLGSVVTTARLTAHRQQAGFRIGDDRHIDLVRYTAWLVRRRHGLDLPAKADAQPPAPTLHEAAQSAAASGLFAPFSGHSPNRLSDAESAVFCERRQAARPEFMRLRPNFPNFGAVQLFQASLISSAARLASQSSMPVIRHTSRPSAS